MHLRAIEFESCLVLLVFEVVSAGVQFSTVLQQFPAEIWLKKKNN